jgi:hypothetical protein
MRTEGNVERTQVAPAATPIDGRTDAEAWHTVALKVAGEARGWRDIALDLLRVVTEQVGAIDPALEERIRVAEAAGLLGEAVVELELWRLRDELRRHVEREHALGLIPEAGSVQASRRVRRRRQGVSRHDWGGVYNRDFS